MMGRRRSRLLAALLLAASAAAGQTCELKVSTPGPAAVVDLRAEGTSAHDLLVRLSAALGTPLVTDGPSLEALSREAPPVHVAGVPAADVVEHLAGAAGLDGRLEDDAIVIQSLPPDGSTSLDRLLFATIRSMERAALRKTAVEDPPWAFRIAMLRMATDDREAALAALRLFFEAEPDHAAAARARLMAARCALDLGQLAIARSILEGLERHHGGSREVLHGQLQLARLLDLSGQTAEAIVRLRRIIHSREEMRLRGLAILQLAELHHAHGQPEEALELLASFDVDFKRAMPDLAERVPLFIGLCLVQAGRHRESIPHLQLALLAAEDRDAQARAAVELVGVYSVLGEATTAILAAETARRLLREGEKLWDALVKIGGLHAQLGVPVLARRAYEEVLAKAPPESPAHRRARRGLADAREIELQLAREPGTKPDAWLGVARCEVALQEWKTALATLDQLPKPLPAESLQEAARLRGRCWTGLGDHVRASLAYQGVPEEPK